MSKVLNWIICGFFVWLTYKFATDGQASMGGDNPKAVLFTLGLAVVFGLSAMSGSSSKS